MKIREVVAALLKENAELRRMLAEHTGITMTDHAGREAGIAALKRIDELEGMATLMLIDVMEPDGDAPTGLPYVWRLDPDDDDDRPDGLHWIVVTADGEEELTGPVDRATAELIVEAFRRAKAYEDRRHLTAAK